MHSHDSITYATKAVWKGLLENGDQTAVRSGNYVCYLPLSHVAGSLFMFSNALCTALGSCFLTHFAFPDALQGSIAATLKEVRPTVFVGVPRVWEKLHAPLAALKNAAPLTSARSLASAIGLDRCKLGLVGAAPVADEILHFFDRAVGRSVFDVYGMTENFALSHSNNERHRKIGSVGKPNARYILCLHLCCVWLLVLACLCVNTAA